MTQEHGTHGLISLLDAKVGDEFGSRDIVIDEEWVERNCFATDDYNPWYMEGSPFGGRIAPPTLLVGEDASLFYKRFAHPPGGTINARQEMEFFDHMKVGQKFKLTVSLKERYERRGRNYFISECLVTDDTGKKIVSMTRARGTPMRVPAEPGEKKEAKKEAPAPRELKVPQEALCEPNPELGDPTAFQSMKVMASRDTAVGFELEPIIKRATLDKSRIYNGWPRVKNYHCDFPSAKKVGFKAPLIAGNHSAQFLGEQIVKFFGEGYIAGKISFINIQTLLPGDLVITKGVVKEKVAEGDAIRLTLDVWSENQFGEQVLVGTTSGLVR